MSQATSYSISQACRFDSLFQTLNLFQIESLDLFSLISLPVSSFPSDYVMAIAS